MKAALAASSPRQRLYCPHGLCLASLARSLKAQHAQLSARLGDGLGVGGVGVVAGGGGGVGAVAAPDCSVHHTLHPVPSLSTMGMPCLEQEGR